MKYTSSQELFKIFPSVWAKESPYYIWGVGNTALRLCKLFQNELNILGFVDNDEQKWGQHFLGHPVFCPNELFANLNGKKIIVASQMYQEIKLQLAHIGLEENVDFCDSRYFVSIHQWLCHQRVYVRRTDLSITSFCNLRCRHCNMLMPYYEHCCHFEPSKVLADVDAYFRWVDYVEMFNILGGEPFLHPKFHEIVREIGKRYRSKIGELVFFSNGTILPGKEMLALMKEYQIKVYIGDYRIGLPALQPKVDAFVHTLESAGLRYDLTSSDSWLDFNHTPTDRSAWSEAQLVEVCENCGQPFRGIHNQSFYFCHLNASAALSGRYLEQPGDSFDLSGLPDGRIEDFIAYDLAALPNGFISYCRHCNGCSPANQQKVPIAEQLPSNYKGVL